MDIKLRFSIDNGQLKEEEEQTLSNGTTRTAIFIPQYDRRIRHDKGLTYTENDCLFHSMVEP